MSITPGIFVEILDLRFVPTIDNTVVISKKREKGRVKFSLRAAIHLYVFVFIPAFLLLLSTLSVLAFRSCKIVLAIRFTLLL
jgi:hypothetical protein